MCFSVVSNGKEVENLGGMQTQRQTDSSKNSLLYQSPSILIGNCRGIDKDCYSE